MVVNIENVPISGIIRPKKDHKIRNSGLFTTSVVMQLSLR